MVQLLEEQVVVVTVQEQILEQLTQEVAVAVAQVVHPQLLVVMVVLV
jgi:hypothetical protein